MESFLLCSDIPLGDVFAMDVRERCDQASLTRRLVAEIPEVGALAGVLQAQEYHREGDVLVHTLLALQALPPGVDERVCWAVLLHDIGKAVTTEYFQGRWRSHGHAEAGERMSGHVLNRLGREDIAEDVSWLVRHHGFALSWGPHPLDRLSKRQLRFCRHPLFPLLLQVARADAAASLGKSDKGERLENIVRLRKKPENLKGERQQ